MATEKSTIIRLYPNFYDKLCNLSGSILCGIHQAFLWYKNFIWKIMHYSEKSNFVVQKKHRLALKSHIPSQTAILAKDTYFHGMPAIYIYWAIRRATINWMLHLLTRGPENLLPSYKPEATCQHLRSYNHWKSLQPVDIVNQMIAASPNKRTWEPTAVVQARRAINYAPNLAGGRFSWWTSRLLSNSTSIMRELVFPVPKEVNITSYTTA